MSHAHPAPSTIGRCPACQTALSSGDVLIEYERDGQADAWADCPECGTIVHPT